MPFSAWITEKVFWLVTLLLPLLPKSILNTSAQENLFKQQSDFRPAQPACPPSPPQFPHPQSKSLMGFGPITSALIFYYIPSSWPHRTFHYPFNIPGTQMPWGFCNWYFFFLECSHSRYLHGSLPFPLSLWANGTFSGRPTLNTPLAGICTLFKFLPLHLSPSNRLYNLFITVYCLFPLPSDLLPDEKSIKAEILQVKWSVHGSFYVPSNYVKAWHVVDDQ